MLRNNQQGTDCAANLQVVHCNSALKPLLLFALYAKGGVSRNTADKLAQHFLKNAPKPYMISRHSCRAQLASNWLVYQTTSDQMAATAFIESTSTQEQQDQQRGRHLVASLQIHPGSRVLCESAASAVLYESEVPRRCHLSFELSQTPLRCGGCKHARYANQQNQRSAWSSGHREECAALAACRPHVPPPTVRLIAKLLWRQTW